MLSPPPSCPRHDSGDNVDRRKSAALAAQFSTPLKGAFRIKHPAVARAVLRNPEAFQAGVSADQIPIDNPEHMSVFFLDGLLHHRKRMAIAKFFSPKTVTTEHRPLMERETKRILDKFQRDGSGQLDLMSFDLAATVVSYILGLTNSDAEARKKRIATALELSLSRHKKGPWAFLRSIRVIYAMMQFMNKDVKPAKQARIANRQNDVISQMVEQNYPDKAIFIECMTYGSAGMLTTREFIVMAAWYLFERPELRERYLNSDENGQLAILLEILRLEPVAALVHRIVKDEVTVNEGETLPKDQLYAIDIRASNTNEELVGACPFAIDPERAERMRENGRYLSFGDGPHNCPGWQVALHETRIFLDQMMRIPGVRLERAPDMTWNASVQGYELRNAIIVCDKAA